MTLERNIFLKLNTLLINKCSVNTKHIECKMPSIRCVLELQPLVLGPLITPQLPRFETQRSDKSFFRQSLVFEISLHSNSNKTFALIFPFSYFQQQQKNTISPV